MFYVGTFSRTYAHNILAIGTTCRVVRLGRYDPLYSSTK